MNRNIVRALLLAALISPFAAGAQSLQSLVGNWRIDVEGSPRPRQFQVLSVGAQNGNVFPLEARYGWLGEKLGVVAASAEISGSEVKLSIVTPANSLVTATWRPGGSPEGVIQLPGGKVSAARLSVLEAAVPAVQAASVVPDGGPASQGTAPKVAAQPPQPEAQGANAFLSKAELQSLVSGKIWTFQRNSDQQRVRWDLRSNGYLFGNNLSTSGSDSATWTINEAAQLCVVWRGNSRNACIRVRPTRTGFEMVDVSDAGRPYATLSVE